MFKVLILIAALVALAVAEKTYCYQECRLTIKHQNKITNANKETTTQNLLKDQTGGVAY